MLYGVREEGRSPKVQGRLDPGASPRFHSRGEPVMAGYPSHHLPKSQLA
jgi:hypothetical protein